MSYEAPATHTTPAHANVHSEPAVVSTPATGTGSPLVHDAYNPKDPYTTHDEKKLRSSSSLHSQNKRPVDPVMTGETNVLAAKEEEDIEHDKAQRASLWRRIRPFALTALALLILGWWISATIITRHRWYVPTDNSASLQLISLAGLYKQSLLGSSFCTYQAFSLP